MTISNHRPLDALSLICGVTAPIVYFGVQCLAAPYCPDYSFAHHDASTLGSSRSTFPALFNVAQLVLGLLLMFAAVGLVRALHRREVSVLLRWPLFTAVVAGSLGSINAGLFPLPDERHTNGLLAQTGALVFLLPFLLPFAFRSAPRLLRAFLWTNLAILLALVPIVSGLVQRVGVMAGVELAVYQEFLNNSHGFLQRIAAGVVFLPIGVVCWYFLRSLRRERAAETPSV